VGPVSQRPKDLIYAVDERPPLGHLTLLGLQHVAALLPYLVLVAIVIKATGDAERIAHDGIALAMVALAIMAILQALRKGPIGSGYLAPPVVSAIYLPPCLMAAELGGLPLVCGMVVFAGLVEMGLSHILPRLKKIFPPVVSGMIIMAVGFELGLIGVKEFLHQMPDDLGTDPSGHAIVAALTLSVMVGLSVWAKGLLRLLCSLIGIACGYVLAVAIGLIPATDALQVEQTPWLAPPNPSFLGAFSFEGSLVIPFVIAALAAGLRVIGVVTTCQRINNADWKSPEIPSIQKGILADGIGCALSGVLGTPGTSAAASLVGLSKASGATSRSIAWSIAFWLLLLACLPKLAMLILIMPKAVIGAALVFNGAFMLVAGIQIISSRPINIRTTLIIGIPTLFGISRQVIPDFYEALPGWLEPATSSIINITLIGAVLANLVFLIGRKRSDTFSVPMEDGLEGVRETPLEQLEARGKDWEVGGEVLSRARQSLSEILALIADSGCAEDRLRVRLSYDDFALTTEIRYQGSLPHLASDQRIHGDLLEEQSFAVGLSGFLSGIHADRIDRRSDGEECRLRLVFEAV